MFLRILKKDLQRQKAANIILLVFIMLAAMFFSSSVNNVIAVLGGIDSFWEKANMPELLAICFRSPEAESTLADMECVDFCDAVPLTVLLTDQLTCNGETVEEYSPFLIPLVEQKLLFFDENNAPITEVAPGTVRVSATTMRSAGLKAGDILKVEVAGEIRELTVAGPLKDATCLARRYIMNPDEYDAWFGETTETSETTETTETSEAATFGTIFYIYTNNLPDTREQLSAAALNLILYEKETLRLSFFPDMILAAILLAVSICLILIAFVVLRFTISFTLQQEFRQIGVMKAIGLSDPGIRGLYLAKYLLLSAVGACIGFFGSVPFSKLLLDSVSETMVLGHDSNVLINALCCIAVVVITLAFCYRCTAKVKKFTPVDAIRSGTTGERFHKKGLLQLSKTPGSPALFLALNDVLSQPRRFGAIILVLFLCLSLVLMLTTSVNTLKSDGLVPAFNMTPFDLICSDGYTVSFAPDGRQMIREDLEETEALLKRNGLNCRCYTEIDLSMPLRHKDKNHTAFVSQGIGTTTDQYVFFEGSAPCKPGEIAVTEQVANALDARIGDTITMQIGTENREFLVTGLYQSMLNIGNSARIHEDELISYEYLTSAWGTQIEFLDDPGEKEIQSRIALIKDLLDVDVVQTASEYVEGLTGMAETLEYVRLLMLAISLIITVLIVVLIGHSFIAKERGDIAILKAIGFRDMQIVSWQALRFVVICMIAVIPALLFHMPLMKLVISPIFAIMGASFGIQYKVIPLEVYCIYPGIFLAVISVSAFLTARYTRTVQTSECSNID